MPKILIAGCGFVGETAAAFFARGGWEVVGLTASGESAARLGPYPVEAADLSSREAMRRVASRHGNFDAVAHCASSGRGGADAYRAVYRDGAKNLIAVFRTARLLFTGSTSVYAQADGSRVDETSEASPDRETGRILREAEEIVLEAGGTVARLAGIYGPGRSVLLRRFLDGTATLEGGGLRWINQVHRDDAARAVFHLLDSSAAPGIYNVCDDTPATQRKIYQWLADYFDRLLPPVGERNVERKRGWTSKRVSNAKLRQMGWTPEFPSYREAIPSLAAGG